MPIKRRHISRFPQLEILSSIPVVLGTLHSQIKRNVKYGRMGCRICELGLDVLFASNKGQTTARLKGLKARVGFYKIIIVFLFSSLSRLRYPF